MPDVISAVEKLSSFVVSKLFSVFVVDSKSAILVPS